MGQSEQFRNNLDALDRFHPGAAKVIRQAPPRPPGAITTSRLPNGFWEVRYRRPGDSTSFLLADPRYQPPARDEEDQASLYFLVGWEPGFQGAAFVHDMPDKNRVVIIEPQPWLFRISLELLDLSHILSRPCLDIFLGDEAELRNILAREEAALRALPAHLRVQQQLARLFPDLYQPLANSLSEQVRSFAGSLSTAELKGENLFANTLENLPALERSPNIGQLANAFQGEPCVCVAAGPSLTKNIQALAEHGKKHLVLGVDTAATVLFDHGITPHLLCSIDPIPASLAKLAPVLDRTHESPLVWAPETFPETLRQYPAQVRFVAPAANDLFNTYLQEAVGDFHRFPGVISVFFLAFHTAQLLGCDPIILVGLDLALVGDQDHAAGAPVSWPDAHKRQRLPVPGWAGGSVETIPVLQAQILRLEELITPDNRTVIDATEGGAKIKGTTTMPLVEALARFPAAGRDYETTIQEAWGKEAPKVPSRLSRAVHRMLEEAHEAEKLAKEGSQAVDRALSGVDDLARPKQRARFSKAKENILRATSLYKKLSGKRMVTALFLLRVKEHHRIAYGFQELEERRRTLPALEQVRRELVLCRSFFTSVLEALETLSRLFSEKGIHRP